MMLFLFFFKCVWCVCALKQNGLLRVYWQSTGGSSNTCSQAASSGIQHQDFYSAYVQKTLSITPLTLLSLPYSPPLRRKVKASKYAHARVIQCILWAHRGMYTDTSQPKRLSCLTEFLGTFRDDHCPLPKPLLIGGR